MTEIPFSSVVRITFNDSRIKNSSELTSSPHSVAVSIILIVIIILGTFSNFVVIISIIRSKKLRLPLDFFIFSHSTSDLLYCLIILPITLNDQLYTIGRNTQTLCFIKMIFGNILGGNSLLLYACIATGRYIAIVHRNKCMCIQSKKSTACQILFCWLIPLIFKIPFLMRKPLVIQSPSNSNVTRCEIQSSGRYIEQTISSTVNIVVPLFIIIFCYMFIYFKIYKSRKRLGRTSIQSEINLFSNFDQKKKQQTRNHVCEEILPKKDNFSPNTSKISCSSTLSRKTSYQLKQREIKTAQIIFVVLFIFIITYIPPLVLRLLGSEAKHPILRRICQIIYPLSMTLYPIVYACFGTRYRFEYKRTLVCFITGKTISDYEPSPRIQNESAVIKFTWVKQNS